MLLYIRVDIAWYLFPKCWCYYDTLENSWYYWSFSVDSAGVDATTRPHLAYYKWDIKAELFSMHFAACFWLWIHGLMLHEYCDTTTLKQHWGLSINETRSWGTSALVTSTTLLRIAQQIVTFLSRTKSPLFPAWLSLTVCENSLIHNVTCMFQQILTKRVKCHRSRFEFFQSQFVYGCKMTAEFLSSLWIFACNKAHLCFMHLMTWRI